MPGFGQSQPPQQGQQQPQQQLPQQPGQQQGQGQQVPPQQQFQKQQSFNQPQEQTLQAGVRSGAPQQGGRQPYYSPAPPQQGQTQQAGGGQQYGQYQQPPHVPEFKVAGVGGGPWQEYRGQHRSRFSIGQLRQSDGIIPLQYGTNRFASQKLMTGFGTPRDVNGKHLHRIWDDFYTDEAEPFEGQVEGQGHGQQQYYTQQ